MNRVCLSRVGGWRVSKPTIVIGESSWFFSLPYAATEARGFRGGRAA